MSNRFTATRKFDGLTFSGHIQKNIQKQNRYFVNGDNHNFKTFTALFKDVIYEKK